MRHDKGDRDARDNYVEEALAFETSPLVIGSPSSCRDETPGALAVSAAEDRAFAEHIDKALRHYVPWLGDLNRAFGYKLLIMLFASQHLMKGFVSAFVAPAQQYLFASYNIQGPRMQIFAGIVQLPWAMKPIIGLISDCFPICGYNKGPYIFGACVLGVVALSIVGKSDGQTLSIECLVMCLFFIQLQASTCDLLTEAKYAEKMQSNPARGPDLMTYVWFGLQGGGLLATLLVGPLMTHYGVRAPFLVSVFPACFILMPLARNYMEEIPQSDQQVAATRRRFAEQKETCFLCVLMFVGTLVLTGVGVAFKSVKLNCICALSVAAIVLTAFSIALRPMIAKVNAFFLLQTSLSFSIGGASFYFYTDKPESYAAGPHFSMEFYTSVLGVVGAVFSLLGIYTYQRYMREWRYRELLLMTNVVASVLSMADVMLLSRLNRKMDIPDHIFVLGASVLQQLIGQWMWMPGVVMTAQMCPRGMEATMYALLAGCHNLGSTIASSTGALFLQWLGCSPSGRPNEDSEFDNLWIGALVSTVLPMFTLLLLPYMIPDARQTDKLLADEDRSATTGSLWQRWTARPGEL